MATPVIILIRNVNTRRTGFAVLYMFTASVVMNLATSLAWYRNPRELGSLPDVTHDLFPDVSGPVTHKLPYVGEVEFNWSEIMDNTLLLEFAATVIFMFNLKPYHRQAVIRRFFSMYGTLQFMRTCTVCLTSLPDAFPRCREITPIGDLSNGGSTWGAMWNDTATVQEIFIHAGLILIPVHPITCGDMIFSGHANTALLFALTWHTYYKFVPQAVNLTKTFVWMVSFFVAGLLCATRVHYTLDVVLSFYFTMTVWSSYHRLIIDCSLGRRFISVWVIDAWFIYPIVEFMETPLEGERKVPDFTGDTSELSLFDLQVLGIKLDNAEEERKLGRYRASSYSESEFISFLPKVRVEKND